MHNGRLAPANSAQATSAGVFGVSAPEEAISTDAPPAKGCEGYPRRGTKAALAPGMNTRIQDTVRRLMELQSLEDRLAVFNPDATKTAEVRASIASLRAKAPATVLAHHDRLRARGKRSVAEVRHGVCCGCHLSVASGLVADVRRGTLHKFENCGRFLYMVEEDTAELASNRPPAKQPVLAVMA